MVKGFTQQTLIYLVEENAASGVGHEVPVLGSVQADLEHQTGTSHGAALSL